MKETTKMWNNLPKGSKLSHNKCSSDYNILCEPSKYKILNLNLKSNCQFVLCQRGDSFQRVRYFALDERNVIFPYSVKYKKMVCNNS